MKDINQSVAWYSEHFICDVAYHDKSWALLKFANTHLALVLPNQHPQHFAITREGIVSFGIALPHRDGTSSVYIQDPDGNHIEMLKLAEIG